MSPTATTWVLATLGTLVGLFSFWAVASLLPGMAPLVQFVGLRQDAFDVPDDIDIKPEPRGACCSGERAFYFGVDHSPALPLNNPY